MLIFPVRYSAGEHNVHEQQMVDNVIEVLPSENLLKICSSFRNYLLRLRRIHRCEVDRVTRVGYVYYTQRLARSSSISER
jgi:hypothetical protein